MSSTNRSDVRSEHISDYYITPIDEVIKFLKAADNYLNLDMDGIILDCCAGGDKNNLMSYPTALEKWWSDDYDFMNQKLNIKTIDIREDSLAELKTDYLTYKLDYRPSVIITNPPFNIAIDIIKKALNDIKDNGYVIMLQKLNFMGSKDRFNFWQDNMPEYIFVHHKRMSFTGKGTDSIEYCHYVWRKGRKADYAKTIII